MTAATSSPGRRCSPARCRSTRTTTRSAPTGPGADDNFVTDSAAVPDDPAGSPRSPSSTRRCATAPSRCATPPTARASSRSRGSTASTRRSTSSRSTTASRPHSADGADVHPQGHLPQGVRRRARCSSTTDGARRPCPSTLAGLSTVVYVSDDRIPRSQPRSEDQPRQAGAGRGVARPDARRRPTCKGDSFYEVTFQRRLGSTGAGRPSASTTPRRTRSTTTSRRLQPGLKVSYRAAVLDNAGHTRGSAAREHAGAEDRRSR